MLLKVLTVANAQSKNENVIILNTDNIVSIEEHGREHVRVHLIGREAIYVRASIEVVTNILHNRNAPDSQYGIIEI